METESLRGTSRGELDARRDGAPHLAPGKQRTARRYRGPAPTARNTTVHGSARVPGESETRLPREGARPARRELAHKTRRGSPAGAHCLAACQRVLAAAGIGRLGSGADPGVLASAMRSESHRPEYAIAATVKNTVRVECRPLLWGETREPFIAEHLLWLIARIANRCSYVKEKANICLYFCAPGDIVAVDRGCLRAESGGCRWLPED